MKTQSPSRLLLAFAVVTTALPLSATPDSGHRRTADLKSFFHGETVPPKAPPPAVTATVVFAPGVAPDPQVAGFMKAFAAAVKARDGRLMLPRLADGYTVDDLPEDHKAADFFLQAVERTPGPAEIVIQSVELKGQVRIARMEFRFPNRVATKTFKFDAAGKLLRSDLFSLKRVHGA